MVHAVRVKQYQTSVDLSASWLKPKSKIGSQNKDQCDCRLIKQKLTLVATLMDTHAHARTHTHKHHKDTQLLHGNSTEHLLNISTACKHDGSSLNTLCNSLALNVTFLSCRQHLKTFDLQVEIMAGPGRGQQHHTNAAKSLVFAGRWNMFQWQTWCTGW